MLNHLLAGIVGFGGLSLFLSGFFFPEVRRKPDFAWSGVALLYALVLWIEGDRTSGGALLGHIFSVALIVWFGWQTLQQRQQFAALEERTAIPSSLETLTPFLKAGWVQITVAYGKTVDWIQNQMGNDDASITPESLTSQFPQADTAEDAWDDNTSTVSTHSPTPVVAAETPEHLEAAIAPTEAETPQTAADLQHNPAQLKPEESLDESPQVAPDASIGVEAGNSATLASEISHNIPVEEIATESKSAPLDEEQNIPNEETTHEDIVRSPTSEYDDESWPPEDPIT